MNNRRCLDCNRFKRSRHCSDIRDEVKLKLSEEYSVSMNTAREMIKDWTQNPAIYNSCLSFDE